MKAKKVILGSIIGGIIGVLWILIYIAFGVQSHFDNFLPIIFLVVSSYLILGFGVTAIDIGIKSSLLKGIIVGFILGIPQSFILLNVGVVALLISFVFGAIWGLIIALVVDFIVKS